MQNGFGHLNSAVETSFRPKPAPPHFLLELEPAYRVFWRNLADAFFFRRSPQPDISSSPAPFWPDVFVSGRMPWLQFSESLLLHVIILAGIWSVGRAVALRPQITPRVAFSHQDVIYYSPSEYLRPIDTGSTDARKAERGEPEYAKQPIISVPREADNRSQTIITPPNVRLNQEVPLPNIVAWDGAIPAPPLPDADSLRVPNLSGAVVAPPPEITQVPTRQLDVRSTSIVAPAPAIGGIATRPVPATQPSIVAPPPSVQNDVRRVGELNIGAARVVAPAPNLPVEPQRSFGSVITLAGQQTKVVAPPPSTEGILAVAARHTSPAVNGVSEVAPPVPSLAGLHGSNRGIGRSTGRVPVVAPPPSLGGGVGSPHAGRQLIALSIHPAVGAPPAEVVGNRRGTFAATPQGKSGAAGTPEITGDSHALADRGDGHGGSSNDRGLPAGIHVGSGSPSPSAADSAGQAGSRNLSGPSASSQLVADNRPMRVTVASPPAAASTAPSALEHEVFGDRKSYSMVLNMPNLNSGGGSWVIRFAELKESVAAAQGNLIAPEPTNKVDPGYPLELMRQNVKGTVTLYAVIHSDGSVGDVRVLNSPDDRLDPFARAALARWHFRPAMKNGAPVALEAVIQIPFRPARW